MTVPMLPIVAAACAMASADTCVASPRAVAHGVPKLASIGLLVWPASVAAKLPVPKTAAACAAAAAEICTSSPLAVIQGLPTACGPVAARSCGTMCASSGAASGTATAGSVASAFAANAAAALELPEGGAPDRSAAAWARLAADAGTACPAPVDHPKAAPSAGGCGSAVPSLLPADGGATSAALLGSAAAAAAASSATSSRSLNSAARRLVVAAGTCAARPLPVTQPPLPALRCGSTAASTSLPASGTVAARPSLHCLAAAVLGCCFDVAGSVVLLLGRCPGMADASTGEAKTPVPPPWAFGDSANKQAAASCVSVPNMAGCLESPAVPSPSSAAHSRGIHEGWPAVAK